MATTIEDLEERLNTFEQSLIQMGVNLSPTVAKVDDTSNRVDALTPYKAVKTAYIGDTEVVFTDVPQGNLSVYFDTPTDYAINREGNNIEVSFEPLEDVTTVTISIIQ